MIGLQIYAIMSWINHKGIELPAHSFDIIKLSLTF